MLAKVDAALPRLRRGLRSPSTASAPATRAAPRRSPTPVFSRYTSTCAVEEALATIAWPRPVLLAYLRYRGAQNWVVPVGVVIAKQVGSTSVQSASVSHVFEQ